MQQAVTQAYLGGVSRVKAIKNLQGKTKGLPKGLQLRKHLGIYLGYEIPKDYLKIYI